MALIDLAQVVWFECFLITCFSNKKNADTCQVNNFESTDLGRTLECCFFFKAGSSNNVIKCGKQRFFFE